MIYWIDMFVELRFIFPKMFTDGMLCIILGYKKQLKIILFLINKLGGMR